jgi:hypothetical protein
VSRCTRKELDGDDEDKDRRDREEGYRRLEIELHRAWREAQATGVYPPDPHLLPSDQVTKPTEPHPWPRSA